MMTTFYRRLKSSFNFKLALTLTFLSFISILTVGTFFMTQKAAENPIVIDRNSQRAYLDNLSDSLGSEGISLHFDSLTFNEKNELVKIQGQISFSQNKTATFASDNLHKVEVQHSFLGLKVQVTDLQE